MGTTARAPVTTVAVEALAVAANPVAAADIGGPTSCLIPLIIDSALKNVTLIAVLVARAATAAVRLVYAVEVAIWARRCALRRVIGRLPLGG